MRFPRPDIDSVPNAGEEAWRQAKRLASELDKILAGQEPRQAAIRSAAAEVGLTTRHIYRLLARYEPTRRVTSLLPRTGRSRRKRLSREVEAIVASTLREKWLVLEAPPLAPVVAEIRARCHEAALPPPTYMTVESRLPLLFTAAEIAKRRSANEERVRRLKARPGYIHAPRPLAVCQIDHTPTDIAFVDIIAGAGAFVGRAYLTILADVFSRCILGFCLTLEKLKTLSVALCLAHAICPKDAWMRSRDLHYPWPTFGRPEKLVTDSAKEFRGKAFERGCEEFGIKIKRRNRGRVHEGGVVERLLGKINAVVSIHYGATGRSVADRDHYPTEKRACLSLAELEKCVALAIIDHNLQQNEKTLKTPLTEWRMHAADLKCSNDDPIRTRLAFLPCAERTLSPQGVSMFALHYYADWLGILVPERDRLGKLVVKYDPRDISHIYVQNPHTSDVFPVPRRDGVAARITLWEHEDDRRAKRAANHRTPVEKVEARRQIAAIAETAQKRTKAEVRRRARSAHAAAAEKPYDILSAPPTAPEPHPVRQKRRLMAEEW